MKKGRMFFILLVDIFAIVYLYKSSNISNNNVIEGNLFINSTSRDFRDSKDLKDVKVSGDLGDGAIILKPNKLKGIYTSSIINTSPFQYLILSWNSDTPKGTSIDIEARVFVKTIGSNNKLEEKWSDWLSWGTWGTTIKRASATGVIDDEVAYVNTDTLAVKGENGETASKIQYRIILNSNKQGITPRVNLISGALRSTLPGKEIKKVLRERTDLSSLKVLNVPRFSQMIRDPLIASYICSPTSIAMILSYYGTDLLPEESAWGVYDYNYDGFGNWSFNVAYASSFGYRAYVDYSTIEELKREIHSGHPVAVSVKYKNSENIEENLPVVDGAPVKWTDGHLIVVCGFTNENGIDYVVVNDPAASSNEGVRVKYKLDQFREAWSKFGNVAYIIHEES